MACNPTIDALLDLQVIDQQRLTLSRAREGAKQKLDTAEKAWREAEAAAEAATAEVAKLGALVRQYRTDAERCDTTIAEQRAKQMTAKTNKEYMAIINAIENTKVEKAAREQSVKDLGERITALEAKAAQAQATAATLKQQLQDLATQTGEAAKPTAEEADLQARYDAIRTRIDKAFLEVYERLVKARHKMPLMRVDPATRSTPFGNLISPNQIEQIRLGKLVVDRTTNSILFLD